MTGKILRQSVFAMNAPSSSMGTKSIKNPSPVEIGKLSLRSPQITSLRRKNVGARRLNIRIGVNSVEREESWRFVSYVHGFFMRSAQVIRRKRWRPCGSFIVLSITVLDVKGIRLRLEGCSFVVRPVLIRSGNHQSFTCCHGIFDSSCLVLIR